MLFHCFLIICSSVQYISAQSTIQNNAQKWLDRYEKFRNDLDIIDQGNHTQKLSIIKKCNSEKYYNQTTKTWKTDNPNNKIPPCWIKPKEFDDQFKRVVYPLSKISMKCRATGSPKTKVRWYRIGSSRGSFLKTKKLPQKSDDPETRIEQVFDSEGIPHDDYFASEVIIESIRKKNNIDVHVLEINQAIDKDDGFYACEVYNDEFPENKLYAFFDRVYARTDASPPHITMDRMNQEQNIGNNATFNCTVHGKQGTVKHGTFVEWFKCDHGYDCGDSQTNWTYLERTKELNTEVWFDQTSQSSILKLLNIDESDAGSYRCNGTNQFGSSIQTGILKIKPQQSMTIPIVIISLMAIFVTAVVLFLAQKTFLQKSKKLEIEEASEKRLLPVVCEENLPAIICEQEPIEPQQEEMYKNFEARLHQLDCKES